MRAMPALLSLGAIFVLALLWPPSSSAQTSPLVSLRIGFDGYVVPGSWVPLAVRVDPGEKGIDGEVMVETREGSRANPSLTRYRWRLKIPPGGVFQFSHAIPYTDARWPVRVEVRSGRTVVFQEEVRPHPVESLVVVLSRVREGVGAVGSPPPVVVYVREEDLPVHPWAYEGVRLLVIHDLSSRRLDEDRRRALLSWIAQGGRVLISTGESLGRIDWEPLQSVLPAIPTSTRYIPPRALAARYGEVFPHPLPVAQLMRLPGSTVSLSEGGIPLMAERPLGRGRVVMWAFDYLDPSFLRWPGRFSLWKEVLQDPPRLRRILIPEVTEILPSSQPLPRGVLLGLGLGMISYIGVICWLMRRFAPLHGWWLGLLLAAIVFSGGFWTGSAVLRSRSVSLAWATTLEAEGESRVAVLSSYLRWIGPPGRRNEILLPKAFSFLRLLPPGSIEVKVEPEGVRVQTSGRLTTLEMTGIAPLPFDGWVQEVRGALEVWVTNRLSQALEDPLLVFQGNVQRLPSLPPGEGRWLTSSGRWLPFDFAGDERALGQTPSEIGLLRWTFPRLSGSATIEERGVPFLLGWIDPHALGVDLSTEPPSLWGKPPGRVLLILQLPWR